MRFGGAKQASAEALASFREASAEGAFFSAVWVLSQILGRVSAQRSKLSARPWPVSERPLQKGVIFASFGT